MNPRAGRFRAALGLSAVGALMPPLIGIAVAPVLTQSMGVVARGQLAASTAPLLLLLSVGSLGLPESLTYHVARRSGHPRALLRWATAGLVLSSLASALVLLRFSEFLSGGDESVQSGLLNASIWLFPGLFVGALRGAAAGLGHWRRIAFERTVGALLKLGGIVIAAASGRLSLTVAILVVGLSTCIGGLGYIGMSEPSNWARGRVTLAQFSSFSGRFWLGSMSGVLLSRIDQLFIAPLSSVRELGLYAVAVSISEIPLLVNSAARDVVFADQSNAPDNRLLVLAIQITSLLVLCLAVVVGISANWVLAPLFGADFEAVFPILVVLLIGVVVGGAGSMAGIGLSAAGHPGIRSVALAVSLILNLVMLQVLVPAHGAVGAAWGTVCSYAVFTAICILSLRRHVGIGLLDLTRIDIRKIGYDLRKYDGQRSRMGKR